ncbi:MAG: hypothetical protein OQJ99_05945 [Rhodospirillales bacterium]|nr:hypothetical protein [Rhodospirillales bacterium]MCW8863071.1 hypothetical protein [Rhodospirillales bacterium]MCW8951682.1 hypothetical protein [Rhodospirillales bacterium]MCW8970649.1 hypothetical protein [Rhodospirillales bacterium]MCW9002265.1 hypothetical protein [Rhodospirillales bacterium]
MIELRISIWQFVRVMVALEEQALDNPSGAAGDTVFDAWRDVWEELDAHLAELGRTDIEAYADMMLDQELVIVCDTAEHLGEVVAAAESVADDLERQLAITKDDEQKAVHLRFEAEGLWELAEELRRLGRAGFGVVPRKHVSPQPSKSRTRRVTAPSRRTPGTKRPRRR